MSEDRPPQGSHAAGSEPPEEQRQPEPAPPGSPPPAQDQPAAPLAAQGQPAAPPPAAPPPGQQGWTGAPPAEQQAQAGWTQPPAAPPPPTGWPAAQPQLPPGVVLATYGSRVAAYLIDGLIGFLLTVPGIALIVIGVIVGQDDGGAAGWLIALGILLAIAGWVVAIWNVGWRQGARGQSWGKGMMGIKLVGLADGVPPGGWIGLGRFFLRQVLGSITSGVYTVLTLLWPLWDDRRQTLDDKILSTLVVEAR